MPKTTHKRNEGMALMMALFFIAIGLVVVGGLMGRMMQQRKVVDQYEDYVTTFQGLEGAISSCKVELETGADGILGMEGWEPEWSDTNQLVLPALSLIHI